MSSGTNRLRYGLVVALAALATAASAAAPGSAAVSAAQDHGKSQGPSPSSNRGHNQSDQGVVQSVTARTIVLKALDGSVVSIPVDAGTRVSVNDRPASLADIKPGFVVTTKWKDGNAAEEVKAVDATPLGSASIVTSVVGNKIVLGAPDGSTVTIHVGARTRIFVDDKPARLHDVKPGYAVTPSGVSKPGKPAVELRFFKR